MLAKFIDEGKCKHEEMKIFVKKFRTTNELLLKERGNLLSDLEIKVNKLSKVMDNVSILKNEVKGVTTRLEEACTETMSERCSVVLLNELPLKEKVPKSFTIPCQVLKEHKEAEDLAANHLSRLGKISLRNEMPQNNIQLNKLVELRCGAYENTRIYKEHTKKWNDSRLCGDKDFKVGDKVLLYNYRLKMYRGKLKSKWSGPNIVKTVYSHGAIEITNRDGVSSKVNGQRLKKYYGGNIKKEDDEVLEFEDGVT
nr:hypothetical protein [Tanacetum cinerariifolium]